MGISKQDYAANHAKIMDAFAVHGTARAVSVATGIPERTVQRHLAGAVRGAGSAPTAAQQPAVGMSFEQFQRQYDKNVIVPAKVRDGLARLGPDRFLPEADFVKLAGVNYTDLGRFRPEFEKHVVVVQEKRLWAGSVELANRMRAAL